MKIVIENTYEELSEVVASILLSEMIQDKRVNLDLTDGSSPEGAYDILSKKMAKRPESYKNVHYYNHDEMEGEVALVNELLKKQIYVPFQVQEENIHAMKFEEPYEQVKEIEAHGGIDLVVTGLGADGHFYANFPGTAKFDEKVFTFDPKDYEWYEDYCKGLNLKEMKKVATFGYKMLLSAKRVVVIANGTKKADAVKAILTEPISADIPGTILRCHPNLVLILDKDSASQLSLADINHIRNQ